MVENGHGGYNQYTRYLSAALRSPRCDVCYLAGTDHGMPIQEVDNVRAILRPHSPPMGQAGKYGFVLNRAANSLRNLLQIRNFAKGFQPHVIHFQIVTPFMHAHLLPVLRKSWPVVLTAHDVVPHHDVTVLFHPDYLGKLYRMVDRVIVHSKANRDKLVHEFSPDPDRVVVVPHGTDSSVCSVPRNIARQRLRLAENGRIVLFLGMIRANKGLAVLIEACSEVFACDRDVRLVIAGTPKDWSEPDIHHMLERHGVADRTTTRLAWLESSDLELYLDAADVCVLPYVDFHAQSGILMQALAHGTPLLVSDAGSLAEVVLADGAGMAVRPVAGPLAGGLEIMLRSDDLRKQFSENAKRVARERYDWRIVATRTEAVYRQAMSGFTTPVG